MIYHDWHTRLSITTPVFDMTAFEDLVEDLQFQAAVDFLVSFTSLLGPRITRIEQALAQGGDDSQDRQEDGELVEALLSLRAGAAMVGARRLEILTTTALTEARARGFVSRHLVRGLYDEARGFTGATARLQHPSALFAA